MTGQGKESQAGRGSRQVPSAAGTVRRLTNKGHIQSNKNYSAGKSNIWIKMQNPDGNMTAMDPAAVAERAREAQYQVSAKMWQASVKMNSGKYNFKLIQFVLIDDVEYWNVHKSTSRNSILNSFGTKEERKWQEWLSTGGDKTVE